MQRDIDFREASRDPQHPYVLADLFRAVRMASKSDLEAIAVIVHLLEHGRVRIHIRTN